MLDAVLFPDEWDLRYHSYDAKWAPGEQVFSMRNGSGDHYFLWFAAVGAVLHGFAHESAMSPWSRQRSKEPDGPRPFPGLFTGLPQRLDYRETAKSFCLDENEVTFCAWWTGKASWRIGRVAFPKGQDPDGSEDLLFILDGRPETYVRWASEYAEEELPLADVKRFYVHEPLSGALVAAIRGGTDFESVRKEAAGMGYPVASGPARSPRKRGP
jgi:hypothetical protein